MQLMERERGERDERDERGEKNMGRDIGKNQQETGEIQGFF